ncbi:MAG: ribulose-phosphate 3-epimerase, partial [Bryobacteraceae bacterium]
MPEHYSPDVVRQLAASVKVPIQAHLMVVEPADVVDEYAKAGASMIIVHAEA